MTTREVYEYILVELNNVNYQNGTLYLEDFNYFMNKAIHEYINRRYNLYNTSQQTTDDLQVITSSYYIQGTDAQGILGQLTSGARNQAINGVKENGDGANPDLTVTGSYLGRQQSIKFKLPDNYYHMLGGMVFYNAKQNFKCYPQGSVEPFGLTRLTADQYTQIVRNVFLKPDYKRPYFYITDTIDNTATSQYGLNPADTGDSGVFANRQSSKTFKQPSIEIRVGEISQVFDIHAIHFDYLRAPGTINLTTAQRDSNEDISQVMEFPNYVCQEIIKIAVSQIMSQQADPRVNTFIPVNESIPSGQQPSQDPNQGQQG